MGSRSILWFRRDLRIGDNPALNAADPSSLSSLQTQTRKELVVKDHVGSVSQVIDIDSHKIVERNAIEPFGLSRGIPLLTKTFFK